VLDLISCALQPARAETAAQSPHSITWELLWTAKAGASRLQELGRQANGHNMGLFGESVRQDFILGILRCRQHQGSPNSRGSKD